MEQAGQSVVTHGRHCTCSACAAQDWAEPGLAACGMHGPSCPPVYAPLGPAGSGGSDTFPADLRAVLEDAGCVIPRDMDVWELLGRWRNAPTATESSGPTRKVRTMPILDASGSCRGWVRLDEDRIGHAKQTQYCITIDTSGYLSPEDARVTAQMLEELANIADQALDAGEVEE